jgi:dTDP-4-dehydrorhamnose reductase
MLRLGRDRERISVVDDQIGAPTSAESISEATREVLPHLTTAAADATDTVGVYHMACAGATSWHGFAQAIFEEFASIQKAPEVMPIPTEAYPTPARRPRNSRLCSEKFAGRFGFRMPEWREALHDVANTMLSKG